MFVALTLFACWLGYQVNWIRQRRALCAEESLVFSVYQNNAGTTMDTLPPLGTTIPQRLLGWLGEPSVPELRVYYIIDENNEVFEDEDGWIGTRATEDFPKIWRARRLFPESEITADYVRREWIEGPDHWPGNLQGLISE